MDHSLERPWRPADVARQAEHVAEIRRLTASRPESRELISKGTGYYTDRYGNNPVPMQPADDFAQRVNDAREHDVFGDVFGDVAAVMWTDHHDAGDCAEGQQ